MKEGFVTAEELAAAVRGELLSKKDARKIYRDQFKEVLEAGWVTTGSLASHDS